MQLIKTKSAYVLHLKSLTWYKDSHSLFDYQSSKINTDVFAFPLSTKTVILYRKRSSCNVIAVENTQEQKLDPQDYQFLTKFDLKQMPNFKLKLNFLGNDKLKGKKINSQRLKTDESSSSIKSNEDDTYIIVRKQKQSTGEAKGYQLAVGQTLKLGRVEFYVSQICVNDKITTANNKFKANFNKTVLKYTRSLSSIQEKQTCKICLEQTEQTDNFLFNPCKCSGSCGTVHLQCLMQWIHIKVKKEVIGGTLHYNFQKFQCEVCKSELPVIIELPNGKNKQLLPIQKPEGDYMILEGACQKSKSVMMIQNVPQKGIKLGRGHECEIRITDISVSRNHAFIKHFNNAFILYDNKSKFGTLVKDQTMSIELANRQQQGFQIGRTIITLDIRKQKDHRTEINPLTGNQERVILKKSQR